MLKAVCFDLDNTLVARDAGFDQLAWFAYDKLQLKPRKIDFSAFLDAFRRFDTNAALTRTGALVGALSQLGVQVPAALCNKVISSWGWKDARCLPRARKTLTKIREIGLLMAIITNGTGANQRCKLKALGLIEQVDVIVISGEVGSRKPDRSIYLFACDALGVEPEAALMVGDHPIADIGGARRVGMKTAWLRPPNLKQKRLSEADVVIDDIGDLPGADLPWPL